MPFFLKKLLLAGIFALCVLASSAQDPFFSQFDALPMQLNPAFAGNDISPEITAIFRDQWSGFPHAFLTYGIAYEQFFEDYNSGIGITLIGDRQADGLLNTYRGSFTYAFGVRLNNNLGIRAGIEASWSQSRIAWEDLRFFDQINLLSGFNDASGVPNPTGEIAPGDFSNAYFDAGAGFILFNKKLYGGLSANHLTAPNASFYNGQEDLLPLRISAQAGARLPFGKRWTERYFSPQIHYIREGEFQMAYASAGLEIGPVKGSFGFRHTISNAGAAVIALGIRKSIFRIGYSYDISVGPVGINSGGSHELSLSFLLRTDEQRNREKALREAIGCPLF